MSMFAILKRPGVARLGAAGLLSEIGDWMLFIALPLFVLQLTGSPLVTATVFVLELVPTVVIGPLAGVLVDRFEPWRLMATVAALQAVLLLPLLLVQSADDLWLVYAVVVAESVLGTVIEPCRTVTAASLVPVTDLMTVNQLTGILSSLARLVGAPLGGLTLGLTGIGGVLVADTATFVAAAALFGWKVGRPAQAVRPEPAAPVRLLADWGEGLAVVFRTPVLRRTMGVVVCMALAQGAFVVLFVLFVVRDLGGTEADVGTLRGVQAIGALAGGALLGLVIKRWEEERLIAVSLAAFGALSLVTWNATALTTAFGLYVGLFIAAGVPGLASMTGLLTVLQTHAPEGARGRVISTFFAVYGGVQAVGMLLSGLVGTGSGLTIALQVQGVLYLTAAALALRLRSRQHRRSSTDQPVTV
ncbi:MAG: MFS transporter [Geodermatophilaceae bacterium]|nr:MFS transporter [Geodermatophilaceae bacterium]